MKIDYHCVYVCLLIYGIEKGYGKLTIAHIYAHLLSTLIACQKPEIFFNSLKRIKSGTIDLLEFMDFSWVFFRIFRIGAYTLLKT